MNAHVKVYQLDHIPGVVMPRQAHTSLVREVHQGDEVSDVCDALMTTNPKIVIGVHTRDCAPICFSNGEKVAVAHVGWRGLTTNLIENVLLHFEGEPTEVFVGPFLHTFEIQKDVCYDAIIKKFGKKFLRDDEGRLMFDFKGAIASLLPPHTIFDLRDTKNNSSLPSHRHKRTLGHIITTVQRAQHEPKNITCPF